MVYTNCIRYVITTVVIACFCGCLVVSSDHPYLSPVPFFFLLGSMGICVEGKPRNKCGIKPAGSVVCVNISGKWYLIVVTSKPLLSAVGCGE